MANDAWVSMPEVSLDFFPAGVVGYLETLMGSRRLVAAGLSGDRISAANAVSHGLLTECCAPDAVDATVERWVSHLVAHPRTADGARRVCQTRFTSSEFTLRKVQLDQIITEATSPGEAG